MKCVYPFGATVEKGGATTLDSRRGTRLSVDFSYLPGGQKSTIINISDHDTARVFTGVATKWS